MDVFDEHVYADTSALPPSMPHAGTRRSPRATTASSSRSSARRSTERRSAARRCRSSTANTASRPPIPAAKAPLYTGTETQKTVDEATQARYYAEAFRLALCQPNVIGIMVFHVVDESALGAWQSGPFYADGTPKSSVPAIRDAALAARDGTAAACPDRTPPAVALSTTNGIVAADATDGVGVGKVSLFVNGRLADVKYAAPYAFTWAPARKGRYPLEVRAADAAGNVGRTSRRSSRSEAAPRRVGDAVRLGLYASAAETRSIALGRRRCAFAHDAGLGAAEVDARSTGVPGSSPASTTAADRSRISAGCPRSGAGPRPPGRFALVATTHRPAERMRSAASGSSGTRTPIVCGSAPVIQR